MPRNVNGLTLRRQRFADEYMVDLNATAAYRRSGFSGSAKVCQAAASRLLADPKVAEYIAAKRVKMQDKLDITQERVLAEYAKLAFLDPRKFYDERGQLIPVPDLPAEVAAAMAGMEISVSRSGMDADGNPEYEDVKKIKFIDKKGALDSLAKHLGMFVDKVEHTGSVTITATSTDEKL